MLPQFDFDDDDYSWAISELAEMQQSGTLPGQDSTVQSTVQFCDPFPFPDEFFTFPEIPQNDSGQFSKTAEDSALSYFSDPILDEYKNLDLTQFSAEPPVGKTGVILSLPDKSDEVYVLIDWLRATLPQENVELIFSLIEKYWNHKPEELDRGRQWYGRCAKAIHSIYVNWQPTTEGRNEMMFDIPGKALAVLGPEKQRELFKELAKIPAFKPTRIDPAIRDYSRTLCPLKANQAWDEEKVKGFRVREEHKKTNSRLGMDGHTVGFGSRGKSGSGKYLRIYDKYVQSNGQDNCIVCELELSDHKALEFWNRLTGFENENGEKDVLPIELWAEFIATHIKGAINFVDCEWWHSIFENISAWKLPAKKKNDASLAKAIEWVKRQVAPMLALILEYQLQTDTSEPGQLEYWQLPWVELVRQLWDEGKKRWQQKHEFALQEALLS